MKYGVCFVLPVSEFRLYGGKYSRNYITISGFDFLSQMLMDILMITQPARTSVHRLLFIDALYIFNACGAGQREGWMLISPKPEKSKKETMEG